jgi:predicted N-acyltransferase
MSDPDDQVESFSTAYGSAEVVRRAALLDPDAWRAALADHCKDSRYYEICETALRQPNFDYRYLVLRDRGGTIRAVQPFFFTNQDLTAGLSVAIRSRLERIRRAFPGFLSLKMLMVGCTAGEGHLGLVPGSADDPEVITGLLEALEIHARAQKVAIITFKDFVGTYRATLEGPAKSRGYVRMPSFPATILPLDYVDFEDYLARRLGKNMRKNLRRKFRPEPGRPPVEMEVTNDVTDCIDEVHPLYLQVLARSSFRFEELTKEYFVALSRRMPERARFFIWRREGRAIAFSACMVHHGTLYDNYLGLDYSVALDLHLYFLTIRDLITWAIGEKLTTYYSTPLNYDPKLHLRFDLAPLDLYVRHVSPWLNPFFGRIAPWLEPTRYDKLLRRFDNYADLW